MEKSDIIQSEINRLLRTAKLEDMGRDDLAQELWVTGLTAEGKFIYDDKLSEDSNGKRFRMFMRSSLRYGFLNLRRREYRPSLSEETQREKDKVKNTLNIGESLLLIGQAENIDLEKTIQNLSDLLVPELRIYFFRHIGGLKIPQTKLEKIKWLLEKAV